MRSHTNKLLRFALASSACIIAAACAKTEPVVVASIPNEYRDRHPIVVAPAEQGIDIFVRGAGKLDQRQTLELRAAADDYKLNGQGRMTILTPVGIYGPNRAPASYAPRSRAPASMAWSSRTIASRVRRAISRCA